jgi:hypothetical protein
LPGAPSPPPNRALAPILLKAPRLTYHAGENHAFRPPPNKALALILLKAPPGAFQPIKLVLSIPP